MVDALHLRRDSEQPYLDGDLVAGLRCVALDDMSSSDGRDVQRGLFLQQKPVPVVVNLRGTRSSCSAASQEAFSIHSAHLHLSLHVMFYTASTFKPLLCHTNDSCLSTITVVVNMVVFTNVYTSVTVLTVPSLRDSFIDNYHGSSGCAVAKGQLHRQLPW